jgi:hypothetical protein
MAKAKAKSSARATTPLKPTEGLNGAPGKSKSNYPTQANRRLEWGTRQVVGAAKTEQRFLKAAKEEREKRKR